MSHPPMESQPGSPPAAGGQSEATQPAGPGVPPRNGTIAWALGFLAYLPVPVLGLIVAAVAQLVVGLGQRKHGGLAAVNGIRAANWGLTQLCWPVLMVIAVLIGVLTGTPGEGGGVHFHPVMEVVAFTMLGLFFVVGLLEAIYAIVGTVVASKGRRVLLPAIPFLRVPRD